jgi:hypothetical protein
VSIYFSGGRTDIEPLPLHIYFCHLTDILFADNLRTNGYFSSTKFIIFPVHLNILVLLGFTALFQALIITIFQVIQSTERDDDTTTHDISYSYAIFQGISFGATHVVTGVKLRLAYFS